MPATRPILYLVCILDPMCSLHFILTDFTLLFADDGKEMNKSEKRRCRACKAIVFAH